MAKKTHDATRRAVLSAVIATPAVAAVSAAVADGKPTASGEPVSDVRRMPRIEPLTYLQADEKTRKIWDEMRPPADSPTQHPGVEPDIFRIMMNHSELFRVHSPFVLYMKNATNLPLRHRELAILRSAWLGGVDEQFVNHTKIGMDSGLTREDVDRVPLGPDAPGWSARDAAVLRGVDELHHWCRIGDATWAALADQYDKEQLLEFLLLVGSYRALSYVQNSVGIRPPGGKSPNIPGNHFQFAG